MKLLIDVGFSSKTTRSDRVIKVAESFGLGLEDKSWKVFDALELEIEQGDVVYITGQSGSGKSVLLREASKKLADAGLKVANIDAIEFTDAPLIDQIAPESMKDAINYLSLAGISDAYLYIRSPKELSDGQRYRFRLAKLIADDADVWVADEFGAVLDRVTAKVVAYNIQKLARKLGKTLIVATTHTDLVKALGPSLIVRKRFHDRVDLEKA